MAMMHAFTCDIFLAFWPCVSLLTCSYHPSRLWTHVASRGAWCVWGRGLLVAVAARVRATDVRGPGPGSSHDSRGLVRRECEGGRSKATENVRLCHCLASGVWQCVIHSSAVLLPLGHGWRS